MIGSQVVEQFKLQTAFQKNVTRTFAGLPCTCLEKVVYGMVIAVENAPNFHKEPIISFAKGGSRGFLVKLYKYRPYIFTVRIQLSVSNRVSLEILQIDQATVYKTSSNTLVEAPLLVTILALVKSVCKHKFITNDFNPKRGLDFTIDRNMFNVILA